MACSAGSTGEMRLAKIKLLPARTGLVWRAKPQAGMRNAPVDLSHASRHYEISIMPMKSPVQIIFAPLLPMLKQVYSWHVRSYEQWDDLREHWGDFFIHPSYVSIPPCAGNLPRLGSPIARRCQSRQRCSESCWLDPWQFCGGRMRVEDRANGRWTATRR